MRLVEGEIMEEKVAKVPAGIDRGRCKFVVGDACDMPALKLGKFDAGVRCSRSRAPCTRRSREACPKTALQISPKCTRALPWKNTRQPNPLSPAVLAANLMCRVPDPAKFLADMKDLVVEGGAFVLVSPFSVTHPQTHIP